MTDEEFASLLARIPIMEEKLNKLLLTFEKIVENQNLVGIQDTEEFPYVEYNDQQAKEDLSSMSTIEEKLEKARKLKEEADELQRKFEL